MNLTDLQLETLKASAQADARSDAQMLSFLLAEGLRFYWQSREVCWGPGFDYNQAADALEAQAIRELNA